MATDDDKAEVLSVPESRIWKQRNADEIADFKLLTEAWRFADQARRLAVECSALRLREAQGEQLEYSDSERLARLKAALKKFVSDGSSSKLEIRDEIGARAQSTLSQYTALKAALDSAVSACRNSTTDHLELIPDNWSPKDLWIEPEKHDELRAVVRDWLGQFLADGPIEGKVRTGEASKSILATLTRRALDQIQRDLTWAKRPEPSEESLRAGLHELRAFGRNVR